MKILIAVDDSRFSTAAVNSVAERPWAAGTEICVVTVFEPLSLAYGHAGPYVSDSVIAAERELAESRAELIAKKVAQLKLALPHCSVEGRVLEGKIATAIIEEAEVLQVDMIVMGSHGRGFFDKMLMGSVAEEVANRARCSVEIIKPKKLDQPKQQKAKAVASKR